MKRISPVLLTILLLAGCGGAAPDPSGPAAPDDAAGTQAVAAAGASANPADAEVDEQIAQLLGEPGDYHRVFDAFKHAVAAKDRAAVAALVSYPLDTEIDRKPVKIESPEAFVEHYDDIVTEDVAKVISAQAFSDLFVNAQGVMFGNGQVWIGGICQDDACERSDVLVSTIQSVD